MIDLKATFDKYERSDNGKENYRRFDRVPEKLHARPDICAFILIDKLLPNEGCNMISAAEHDEIFLNANCEKLAEVATEKDILTLVRCGVRYDSTVDSLAMFV